MSTSRSVGDPASLATIQAARAGYSIASKRAWVWGCPPYAQRAEKRDFRLAASSDRAANIYDQRHVQLSHRQDPR